MSELLTAAEMRAIERAAMEAGRVTGLALMERAGQGVVEAILARWPALGAGAHHALVLAGPGNNGGDGFVIARLLAARGWSVDVHAMETAASAADALENRRRWEAMGPVATLGDVGTSAAGKAAIVVDALFGAGLTRPVTGAPAAALAGVRDHPRIVAVDGPSGLDLDSGRVLGEAVSAALSVTFTRARAGHVLAGGAALTGGLVVVPLGAAVEAGLTALSPPPARLVDLAGDEAGASARHALDKAAGPGGAGAHKYAHGHALVLSGGVGKGGAARLAARGALRIGAGLVTLGCPPAAVLEHAARLDAIMVASLPDAAALEAEIAARRIRAVCIGPGFGTGARLRDFMTALLDAGREGRSAAGNAGAGAARPAVVLDADALGAWGDDAPALFAMLHEGCVLTPHEGEFGRLFPDILERLRAPAERGPAFSKLDAARAAAARAGAIVLFKGADTVIAAPDGRASVVAAVGERAAPWLATAGSGDVLAGMITGLLARGFGAMPAAEIAAWLHGEAARAVGPGLIAEDLPESLPRVFRDLGL